MFQNNLLMAAASISGDAAYEVDYSCRFNDDDSTVLTRTFDSGGNRKTYSLSFWMKRSEITGSGTAVRSDIAFNTPTEAMLSLALSGTGTDDLLKFVLGVGVYPVYPNMLFRDPHAWYHVLAVVDTTQAQALDRMVLYINGKRQTSLFTATYPTLNYESSYNDAVSHTISRSGANGMDGYLSQMAFIGGTAMTPTDFGEFNNGVWRPIDITGLDYTGTNSFLLDFADSSDLGNDISGNNNDFTSSGLAANDQMTDTPTDNVCTLSPLRNTGGTLANGNLQITAFAAPGACAASQSFSSGKKYWEVLPDSGNFAMGILADNIAPAVGSATGVVDLNSNTGVGSGTITDNGSSAQTGLTTYTSGDVIGVAVNADSGLIDFYKDEVQIGVQEDFSAMSYSFLTPFVGRNGPSAQTGNIVFNEDDFTYTPPTGYTAISTTNAPEPTVKDGRKYFDTILYEGNGAGQKVGQFQPITETFSVDDSAMFEEADATKLTRTPGSASNQKTWTWSFWLKPSFHAADPMYIFNAASGGGDERLYLQFQSAYKLELGNSSATILQTNRIFKDVSQWYNIILRMDTTQSTASDRVRLYINGVQETSFATDAISAQVAEDSDQGVNNNVLHEIGWNLGDDYYSGYMAQVALIDGSSLAPSSFGEVDSTTNRWIPKDVSGLTFGTNGFFLDFADKNDLGDDESGNTNDWAESGFDTTNGSNQFHDTPTRNFLTGDTFQMGSGITISNGGLTSTADESGSVGIRATNLSESTVRLQSGKWYFEYLIDTIDATQVQPIILPFIWEEVDMTDTTLTTAELNNSLQLTQGSNLEWRLEGTNYAENDLFTDLANGDVVGFAIDADNNKIYISLNDTWATATGDPDSSGAGISFPFNAYRGTYGMVRHYAGSKATANYGQWEYFDGTTLTETADAKGYFRFTPPTDYLALNNDNLTETDSFQTGFSWTKNRDVTDNHMLFDRTRGRYQYMSSDVTTVETTDTNSLQRFLKQGQLIGNADAMNTSMESFVSWDWFIETTGSGTANADGATDTTATLVDTTSGFSISTYTGTGSATTFGHGLGAVPKFIIVKERANDAGSWFVYHASMSADPQTDYMVLDDLGLIVDDSTVWNDTAPTSTVFSVGTHDDVNASGDTYVALCFSEIEGFSAFGSYTGNGVSGNGPLIYTGFAPAWLMIRRTDVGESWHIKDDKRSPYNPRDEYLDAATTQVDNTYNGYLVDFLSTGFKPTGVTTGGLTLASINADGGHYMYMAWAANPFGGASTTPATAL